jgi:hypothetical protein
MQTVQADVTVQSHDYQAEFARNLIDTLGLDEALYVCAQNCWAGIRAVIMSERRRSAH